MADITFACPHCAQNLEAPPDMMGTEIACPGCSKPITIPEQRLDEGPPAVVPDLNIRIVAPAPSSSHPPDSRGHHKNGDLRQRFLRSPLLHWTLRWGPLVSILLFWFSNVNWSTAAATLILAAMFGLALFGLFLDPSYRLGRRPIVPIISIVLAALSWLLIGMMSLSDVSSSTSAQEQLKASPARELLGHWVDDSSEEVYYSPTYMIFPAANGNQAVFLIYRVVGQDAQKRLLVIEVKSKYGQMWTRREMQFSTDYRTLTYTLYQPGIDIGVNGVLHYVDARQSP